MLIKIADLKKLIEEAVKTRVLKEPAKTARSEATPENAPTNPAEDPNSVSATLSVPVEYSAGDIARLYSGTPKVEWVPLYDAPCGNIVRWGRSGTHVTIAGRPGSRNVKVSYLGGIFYVRLTSLRSSLK